MAAEASAGNTTKSIESAVKRGEIHRFVAEMDGDIPEELSWSTLGLLGVQEYRAAGACRFEFLQTAWSSIHFEPLVSEILGTWFKSSALCDSQCL